MSLIKNTVLFGTFALIKEVVAHGIVTGVVADGKYFLGYDPSFQYQQNPPEVAGWTAPLTQDRGFVAPDAYGSSDIICHKGATPGKAYIQVSAGGKIELQWTVWPDSHHGPVLDYLAPCGDDCTTVDKTALQWTKIDEAGLNSWDSQPGDWASDDMIRNNNSWVTTIPSSLAAGKYVLRHEVIALHSAYQEDGAQNYPQCMNIEVSGSGSNDLSSGTLGTAFYKSTDPGIFVDIYNKLASYIIPGPPVMAGGSSGSPSPSASGSAPTSAPAPASSLASADVSVTATPTTGVAIPTDTSAPSVPAGAGSGSGEGSNDHPSAPESTPAPAPEASPSPEPEPEPSTPAPSTTTPAVVSFSSTLTGRIGKPTKFVCYLEED